MVFQLVLMQTKTKQLLVLLRWKTVLVPSTCGINTNDINKTAGKNTFTVKRPWKISSITEKLGF